MRSAQTISIAGRRIGPDHPPYIVAEMSGNHNGDIERAFRILDAAKAAGADAVKIQTYRADTITIDHSGPGFVVDGGLWDGRRLFELYEEAHTPWDWHGPIFEHGRKIGITVFSSPFDATAVDFLEDLAAPCVVFAPVRPYAPDPARGEDAWITQHLLHALPQRRHCRGLRPSRPRAGALDSRGGADAGLHGRRPQHLHGHSECRCAPLRGDGA